jgi:hypothetical protein
VWQIADDSSTYFNLENPKVVIRRGMMGGFFLGSKQQPFAASAARAIAWAV